LLPALAILGTLLTLGLTESRPSGQASPQGDPPGPLQAATAPPAGQRIYLPIIVQGWLEIEVRRAATAQVANATLTARARPSSTRTASPSPVFTPSDTPTPIRTPTFLPTETPSPTPTPLESPTPSPTATGPTPTPTITATASDTPTASATPTITPTPTPRDAAIERLRPQAAWAEGENIAVFDRRLQTYRLQHRGAYTLTWELDLGHPDIERGRLSVREVGSGRYPVAGAGLYYRQANGQLVEPRLFSLVGAVTEITHSLLALPDGPGMQLTISETLEDQPHRKRFTIRMVGSALELRAQSLDGIVEADSGGYIGLTVGDIEGAQDAVGIRLPYMDAVPVTMLDHKWFVSSLLDQPMSHAGVLAARGPEILPGAVANELMPFNLPDAAGRSQPVDERIWITLSPRIEDVFAVPDGGPARHRAALSDKLHVTLRDGGGAMDAARDAAMLRRWKEWRVDELIVHRPRWSDPAVQPPGQAPPAPAAAFADLADAAGGLLAPTLGLTLTVAPCPGRPNPRYDIADRVIGADGLPKPAGDYACGAGQTSPAYLLAPNAASRIAADLATELSALGIRAVDLAAPAAFNPVWPWPGAEDSVIDRSPRPNHPATLGQSIAAYKDLFQTLQTRLGPVFGPGTTGVWERGYDSFYAGYLDGASRSLSTGSGDEIAGDPYLVVPDYELSVVRPRMLGYGMGPYAAFFVDADGQLAGTGRRLTEPEIDSWRATNLAYGHAGAWTSRSSAAEGQDYLSPAELVKEFHLMRALQRRYLDAELLEIRYVGPEGPRDLSGALAEDYDLAQPRLRIAYQSAGQRLDLWINQDTEIWTVQAGGQFHLLPEQGWLALGEDGLVAYSALVEGRHVDYLRAPELRLMDGRGRATNFEGEFVTDLVLRFADGMRLVEQPGGTLEWVGP
jgi:hypothetical protein